jgi:hypothetical protein
MKCSGILVGFVASSSFVFCKKIINCDVENTPRLDIILWFVSAILIIKIRINPFVKV